MTEYAPQPEQQERHFLASAATDLYDRSMVALGSLIGAVAANKFAPPNVEIAPGLATKATLTHEAGVEVGLGPLIPDVNLNNVPTHVPTPLYEGVRLDITDLSLLKDPQELLKYAGVFTHYEQNVADPIKAAILERMAEGAACGALFVTGLYTASLIVQNKLAKKDQENLELKREYAPHLLIPGTHPAEHKKRTRSFPRPLAGIAMIAALSGCSGAAVYGSVKATDRPAALEVTAVPPEYAEFSSIFRGATISGPFQTLPQTAIDIAVEKTKVVDDSMDDYVSDFLDDFNTFLTDHPEYRALKLDSRYISMVQLSDTHCSFPVGNKILPAYINAVNPDLVINTGDTLPLAFSGSVTLGSPKKKFSLETLCYSLISDAIGDRPQVKVNGNHDTKTKTPGTITLNKDIDYHAKALGIDFVGDDDPENTVLTATPEDKKDELKQETAKRAERIASITCKIQAKNKGIRPIALAHRREMLAGVLKGKDSGCASIALSGHRHHEGGFHTLYADSGAPVVEHNAASSSGAGTKFSPYDNLARNAVMSEIILDKETHEIAGILTTTFLEKGGVKTTFQTAAKPAEEDPEWLTDFDAQYMNR